jgi:hypothetical protein
VRTIPEILKGIKALSPEARERVFYVFLIVLVSFLSFGIGRLSDRYGGAGELRVLTPEEAAASVDEGYPPPPGL